MNIFAVSRVQAAKLDLDKVNLISINDKELLFPDEPNVLSLVFDDIERPWDGLTLFTPEQAQQIVDFLDNKLDLTKPLYVHCTMGICRSGAVAKFANEYLFHIKPSITIDEYQSFYKNNPQIIPNSWVTSVLNKYLWVGKK